MAITIEEGQQDIEAICVLIQPGGERIAAISHGAGKYSISFEKGPGVVQDFSDAPQIMMDRDTLSSFAIGILDQLGYEGTIKAPK